MRTAGRHVLLELYGCSAETLDDVGRVRDLMRRAAAAIHARILGETFHRFKPRGVSGVVVVGESHLGIHTWPEVGYAAIDIYTCGTVDPSRAVEFLAKAFECEVYRAARLLRGLSGEVDALRSAVDYGWVSIRDLEPLQSGSADKGSDGLVDGEDKRQGDRLPLRERAGHVGRERHADKVTESWRGLGLGVGIIVWKDRERRLFLLGLGHSAENRAQVYAFPGGHVEVGESLEDAVKREVREEAGIEVEDVRLILASEFFNSERHRRYAVIGFEGFRSRGEPRVMEPEKKTDWGWYSPEAALELSLFPPDRLLVERLRASKGVRDSGAVLT